jgi:ethanolamine utilization protein EutN
MLLARAVGTATSTVKHASMEGCKLLVVQPLAADGTAPDGYPQLAIDRLGVGCGDLIVITSDGRTTRELLGSDNTPVRWSVIGIVD